MSALPDVLVVIVNFNTRERLRGCLASVTASEGMTAEIWVVDNASSDGSADLVETEFPDVHLVRSSENLGFAAANNLVMKRASGRYILLLNPDTEVPADALRRMVDFLETRTDAGICGPHLLNSDGSSQSRGLPFPTMWSEIRQSRSVAWMSGRWSAPEQAPAAVGQPRQVDWVSGACLMIRPEVVERIGMLDEQFFIYAEELDWCFRAGRAGWKVYALDDVSVIHHQAQSMRQLSAVALQYLVETRLRYYRKHYGFAYAAALSAVYLAGYLRHPRDYRSWIKMQGVQSWWHACLGRIVRETPVLGSAMSPPAESRADHPPAEQIRPTMRASGDPRAFVRVSPRDPRYFELSDGRPYVPIGMNLVEPPIGHGLAALEHLMTSLASHGGNYCRFWLGCEFFDVECFRSGQYDEVRARRIDRALDAASRLGLRVKMCIDQFRSVGPAGGLPFNKPLHHVSRGGSASTTADFFDQPACRAQFKRKLAWLTDRYRGDPRIFGWELWNEIDCVDGGDWLDWTRDMLAELNRLCPATLAMQSLGSLESSERREAYESLCSLPGNQVAQIHRYRDLGAPWSICHGAVDVLAADAVASLRAMAPDRPVLLAECGAVEPNYIAPSVFYARDRHGIILHDFLFAPFLSGAAGPGQMWHWDSYVERMNLWHHFARFAEAISGIDPPAEQFEPVTVAHPRLRILALVGRRTILVWCRDALATWRSELEEGRPAEPLHGVTIDLPAVATGPLGEARVYNPWTACWSEADAADGRVTLPDFSRSIVVRAVRHTP